LKIQLLLFKAIEQALNDDDTENMDEVMALLTKQHLPQQPERWIKELNGEALSDQMLRQLKVKKAKEKEKRAEDSQKKEQARAVAPEREVRGNDNGEKMAEKKEDQLADTVNHLAEANEDLEEEEATLSEDQKLPRLCMWSRYYRSAVRR